MGFAFGIVIGIIIGTVVTCLVGGGPHRQTVRSSYHKRRSNEYFNNPVAEQIKRQD